MKKFIHVIIALILVILVTATLVKAQESESVLDKRFGIIYTECGTPYRLRVLSVNHGGGHLYMLTESKYFTEKSLTVLFKCLSNKYPEFPLLTVTLMSDPGNLEVAIKNQFRPRMHENPTTDTSINDCKNLREAQEPCPYGYYRANYFRFDGREHFEFSDDPNKVAMKRITLNSNSKP